MVLGSGRMCEGTEVRGWWKRKRGEAEAGRRKLKLKLKLKLEMVRTMCNWDTTE